MRLLLLAFVGTLCLQHGAHAMDQELYDVLKSHSDVTAAIEARKQLNPKDSKDARAHLALIQKCSEAGIIKLKDQFSVVGENLKPGKIYVGRVHKDFYMSEVTFCMDGTYMSVCEVTEKPLFGKCY